MANGRTWSTPIGHIVKRVPSVVSTQDASHLSLGVQIPKRKILCLIVYSKEIVDAIKQTKTIHINALEFIAIWMSFLMTQLEYETNDKTFPPSPTLLCYRDNTSANSWVRKIQTESALGQNLLRMFAEYTLDSPVHVNTDHIAGKDNIVADDISRVSELFSPPLSAAYSCPFPTLIQQIVLKYTQMRSWRVFLPNPEIIADMRSALLSDSSMEGSCQKRLGRFVPVEHILSGGLNGADSLTTYFPETVL